MKESNGIVTKVNGGRLIVDEEASKNAFVGLSEKEKQNRIDIFNEIYSEAQKVQSKTLEALDPRTLQLLYSHEEIQNALRKQLKEIEVSEQRIRSSQKTPFLKDLLNFIERDPIPEFREAIEKGTSGLRSHS